MTKKINDFFFSNKIVSKNSDFLFSQSNLLYIKKKGKYFLDIGKKIIKEAGIGSMFSRFKERNSLLKFLQCFTDKFASFYFCTDYTSVRDFKKKK